MSRLPVLTPTEAGQLRSEWIKTVEALVSQVREWAKRRGWTVTEEPREVVEERLGAYTVPALTIDTPRGHLMLEPIAWDVAGAQGRVDFSVWPSLFRVMLLRQAGDNWIVRTDSGINWPHPWGESTFLELADALSQVS